jgi:hypothetical protein
MTQEEKRIKLAEADGFTQEEPWLNGRKCWGHKNHPKHIGFEEIPDYFNDLNAVHGLEKTLQHYGVFVDRLAEIMGQPRQGIMLVNANAAQRAEAIGKTLNLW